MTEPAAAGTGTGITLIGPASVVSPVVGAATDGTLTYLVSRGLWPPTVGVYDIAAGRTVANVALPSGGGGWGATIAPDGVYVGTYGDVAEIFRVDPATKQVSSIIRLDGDTFVWDLATTPDGCIVAGSSPTCRVVTFNPVAGTVRDYGRVDDEEMYVRSVAASDTTIYAGVGPRAHLVAVDRATGTRRDILPAELAGESWVYAVTVTESLLIIGTEPGGKLAVIDRADPGRYRIADTDRRAVDQIAVHGADLWFTTRTDGALHHYDAVSGSVREVGAACPGEETRLLAVLQDGRVFGVTGSGVAWSFDPVSDPPSDPSSGAMLTTQLESTGLRAGPEVVQSLAAHDGRVFVGGHWSLTVHDVDGRTIRSCRLSGEPKAMTADGGRVYFTTYPDASIGSWSCDEGAKPLGPLAALQNRPRDICLDDGRLLVASMAEYGHRDGALTVHDTRTGQAEGYAGLVPDQTINAVVVDGETAYLATQIDASAVVPVATEAVIAAFDLTRRRLSWQAAPIPGLAAIRHLAYLNGLLYATAGEWVFSFDPVDRAVVRQTGLEARAGQIVTWQQRLFTVTSEQVLELDPDTLAVRVLADGLGAEWHNEPNLAIDRVRGVAYTLRGRDLRQIDLDPPVGPGR